MGERRGNESFDYSSEVGRFTGINTIDKPLFEAGDRKTWEKIYQGIERRVLLGSMLATTQGQIFILAQRWGLAIDALSDKLPKLDYEKIGAATADAFEQALTGSQASKALALLAKTHKHGKEIAEGIAHANKQHFHNGTIFDYAERRQKEIWQILEDFKHEAITPPRYSAEFGRNDRISNN